MTRTLLKGRAVCLLLAATLLSGTALAHEEEGPPARGMRWDVSLDLPVWPSLSDLQPVAPGSFDDLGFGLGMSAQWSVKQFASSELMLGVDGSIAATDSSVSGGYEDLLGRQIYLGASAKWLVGDKRNLSFDVGIGYHEVDMAQVDSDWYDTWEHEHWSSSKPSGYVGATWDIGAGRPHRNDGVFVGFRVHFVDFGRVYDEDNISPVPILGTDAGALDGPLYFLRIGYSSR